MCAAWEPIESNPDVLNEFLKKIGVNSVKFIDIYSFDDEKMLSLLPIPQLAVILSVPHYEKYAELMKSASEGEGEKPDVFFVKQKITNSSGSLAVFHCLANLDGLNLGSGAFNNWLNSAKSAGVDERSESLVNDVDLAAAHAETAKIGSSQVPAQVQHHFIAFVLKNGHIYEIDSRAAAPRVVGDSTEGSLVLDVGKIAQDMVGKMGSTSFSAVALVPQ